MSQIFGEGENSSLAGRQARRRRQLEQDLGGQHASAGRGGASPSSTLPIFFCGVCYRSILARPGVWCVGTLSTVGWPR
jgi:hypothetical protein